MNKKWKKKTCKQYCEKIFLPEREKVEIGFVNQKNKLEDKFSNQHHRKLTYRPIKSLQKQDKILAKLLKHAYLKTCHDIYCRKSCKNTHQKWLSSFTKTRKYHLRQRGARSGCRDLRKEFPEYKKYTTDGMI